MEHSFSRKEIIEILREKVGLPHKEQEQHLCNFISTRLSVANDRKACKKLTQRISSICSHIFPKLREHSRTLSTIIDSEWGKAVFDFSDIAATNSVEQGLSPEESGPSTSKGGRPKASFKDSSDVIKRRKTESVRKSVEGAEEIAFAASMVCRKEGNIPAAKLMKEMMESPQRALKIEKAYKKSLVPDQKPIPYTNEEALTYIINNNLSKQQYQNTQSGAKKRRTDIYPAYNRIREVKKQCYPTNISVTEKSAEVNLQDLLDHTAKRIIEVQEEVLSHVDEDVLSQLILISKWGCDGSSGQSQFKQKASHQNFSDADLFLASLVPLQLQISHNTSSDNII